MKQLVVTPSFPFSTHTFVTREIAETLLRGHDVIILAPDDGDAEGQSLVHRLNIDNRRIIYADILKSPRLSPHWKRFYKSVRLAARREEYGLLLAEQRKTFFSRLLAMPLLHGIQHIHVHFAGWAYAVAMPLSRIMGVPYTITVHDSHLAAHSVAHLQELQESAAAITLPCQEWRDIWQAKTGRLDRLHIIPNAVDTQDFAPPALNASNRDELKLLTVSRLVPHKRVADGLLAVSRLLNKDIPVRYTVIGAGPEEDALLALSQELGISSKVKFLGAQPHTRVVSELKSTDIYMHPSANESFGVAVIEAMAAFLPVVAARSGGTQDTIDIGVTGELYTPGDIEGLAAALIALARDPDQRARWGRAGRARVEQLFSWDSRMASLLAVWQQALAGKEDAHRGIAS